MNLEKRKEWKRLLESWQGKCYNDREIPFQLAPHLLRPECSKEEAIVLMTYMGPAMNWWDAKGFFKQLQHPPPPVDSGRTLLDVLPPEILMQILKFVVMDPEHRLAYQRIAALAPLAGVCRAFYFTVWSRPLLSDLCTFLWTPRRLGVRWDHYTERVWKLNKTPVQLTYPTQTTLARIAADLNVGALMDMRRYYPALWSRYTNTELNDVKRARAWHHLYAAQISWFHTMAFAMTGCTDIERWNVARMLGVPNDTIEAEFATTTMTLSGNAKAEAPRTYVQLTLRCGALHRAVNMGPVRIVCSHCHARLWERGKPKEYLSAPQVWLTRHRVICRACGRNKTVAVPLSSIADPALCAAARDCAIATATIYGGHDTQRVVLLRSDAKALGLNAFMRSWFHQGAAITTMTTTTTTSSARNRKRKPRPPKATKDAAVAPEEPTTKRPRTLPPASGAKEQQQ